MFKNSSNKTDIFYSRYDCIDGILMELGLFVGNSAAHVSKVRRL